MKDIKMHLEPAAGAPLGTMMVVSPNQEGDMDWEGGLEGSCWSWIQWADSTCCEGKGELTIGIL